MLPAIPLWVHVAALTLVLKVAVSRGDRLVRAAAIYNMVSVASCWVAACVDLHYFHREEELAAVWAGADAGFYILLLSRAEGYWAIGAVGVSLVNLATNVGQLLLHTSGWAYGTALVVWFYALDLVILLGALTSERSRRRSGATELVRA